MASGFVILDESKPSRCTCRVQGYGYAELHAWIALLLGHAPPGSILDLSDPASQASAESILLIIIGKWILEQSPFYAPYWSLNACPYNVNLLLLVLVEPC